MTKPIPSHEISVVADRRRIPGWKDYTIEVDMLQPADSFNMSVQFTAEAWKLLRLDQQVSVFIDDTPILTGYIDERIKSPDRGSGTNIQITGRDKSGRLVDESAPLFQYGGLDLRELAEKITGITDDANPVFETIELSNDDNRSLLRNVRARQALVIREPIRSALLPSVLTWDPVARTVGLDAFTQRIIKRAPLVDPGIFRGRAAPKKVEPGSSRWQVLEQFVSEARLIAWSTADGRALFIGLPNYTQKPQYLFFEAASASRNRDETNCAIELRESIAERYSKITAVGASRGTSANYGRNVTRRRGTVYDDDRTADGTGINFLRRKELVFTDDSIKTAQQAIERAEREQFERDAMGTEILVRAPGHAQLFSGETPAIYAVDTMARVVDEDTGTDADFLITAVTFRQTRGQGTTAEMRLVPKGTVLTL